MDATRGAATMKSVSIMWAEGVSEAESQMVVGTIKDFLRAIYDICLRAGVSLGPTAIRPFGTWIIPSLPRNDPYSGTHWYIDSAYDQGLGQVVAPRFLDLVKREPWQTANPHFDIAILDRDLTDVPEKRVADAQTEFVLASALPGTATVISVHRLRELPDETLRLAALKRLVIHNFGHVLGVPTEGRVEALEISGGERHCTNLCGMRHAGSVAELVEMVTEEASAGVLLCRECRRDVLRSVLLQRLSSN